MLDNIELDRLLNGVFGGRDEIIQQAFDTYQKMYNLPVIEHAQDVNPTVFYRYTASGRYFILLAICNQKHEVLVVRDVRAGAEARWKLIGSRIEEAECIEDALERITRVEASVEIDRVEPLALVTNTFQAEGQKVIHCGLAFLVHTRQEAKLHPLQYEGDYVSEVPGEMGYANREVLSIAKEKLHEWQITTSYDEIDSFRARSIQNWIHHVVVNAPFRLLSSRQIKKKVLEHVEEIHPSTILDVACGTDTLIVNLANHADLCVANDLTWDSMQGLRRISRRRQLHNIHFVNHTCLRLPFRRPFDVVISKNMIHHLRSREELRTLLDALEQICSHRLIIVDIEAPTKSTTLARLWNWYYRFFLGDRGGLFLTWDQFQGLIMRAYSGASIACHRVSTVKGNYMFAIVDFNKLPLIGELE